MIGGVELLGKLAGKHNAQPVIEPKTDKLKTGESPKAPVIKKLAVKKLSLPEVQFTSADGKAALDLIFEQLETEQAAEQKAQEDQRLAEQQAKKEQMESICEFVAWMKECPLKFIQDVESKLSLLDPQRREKFLKSEIPGSHGITVGEQKKAYEKEIRDAKKGDDLTIELCLTVAEETFWLSAKHFSSEELEGKIRGLVTKNVIQENLQGSIEGLGKVKYFLAERFDNLDSTIKADLENQLKTEISNQVIRLKKETREENKEKTPALVAPANQDVPLDELFFGNPNRFHKGKSSVMAWQHQGHDNVIKLTRWGNDLYIDDVVGDAISESFKRIKQAMPEDLRKDGPSIPLYYILAKNDRQHLCPTKNINGKQRFQYGAFIEEKFALEMALWIRLGAGHCLPPHRLLQQPAPANNNGSGNRNGVYKKQPVKSPGELLTDEEFFYEHGLGGYDLVFSAGFHYKVEDRNWNPTGEVITLDKEAILRIQREEAEGENFILLESTNSSELASMLEKANLHVYGERDGIFMFNERFKDEPNWKFFPTAIRLALKLAFGRMKEAADKSA